MYKHIYIYIYIYLYLYPALECPRKNLALGDPGHARHGLSRPLDTIENIKHIGNHMCSTKQRYKMH